MTRRMLGAFRGGAELVALLLLTACATGAAGTRATGGTVLNTRAGGPRLPPVPAANGELRIDVVYPGEGATIAVRDSTFIFGNVGRGDATVTINGASVDVAPNGAWLAFLPVPADGNYRVNATGGGQTATLTRMVRVPAAPVTMAGGALRIVEGSVTPSGAMSGTQGERIEVRFRGTPGAEARLRLPDGTVVPLTERVAIDRTTGFMLNQTQTGTGIAEYVGSFELGSTLAAQDRNLAPPTLGNQEGYIEERERQATSAATVELVRGTEVVRAPLPAGIAVLERGRPRVAIAATARSDSTVIGRRALGADQAWDFFWPNGTLLAIDGEAQGFYRVRLTDELTAWVSRDDVKLLPPGTPSPTGFVGPSIQLTPQRDWIDVRFSTSTTLPFRVLPSEFGLSVEFYGATGRPAYVSYGEEDEFVRTIDWDQPSDQVFRFNVHLDRVLWGYRYRWDGGTLLVQVRRPPVIDPASPLRGLRIGVDAGHRGAEGDIGAIGPTRLTEVVSTLEVTKRIVPLLRARGAEVLETRPDTSIVPLGDRPVIAEKGDVHLFFSVHFNAFPDGVNPFENHGTIVFYYWPQSLDFARHVQRELLGEIGLPDRGVRYQNLAITRTTWMPAILTETLFLMFPDQEAATRNPAFLERIAEAHVRAMESFVRDRIGVRAP
jgi:N-acetylmuramoyl-L-alanine amidase